LSEKGSYTRTWRKSLENYRRTVNIDIWGFERCAFDVHVGNYVSTFSRKILVSERNHLKVDVVYKYFQEASAHAW